MADQEEVNLHLTAKDDATEKVSALDKRLDQLTDEDRIAVLKADATAAQREIEQLTRKLADAKRYDDETIAMFVEARGNAQQRLGAIQAEVRALDGATPDITPEVDTSAAETKLSGLKSQIEDLDGPLGDLAGKLSRLASPAAGGAAVAAGLVLAGEAAANTAIEADNLAKLTGDSVENASRLNNVWKQTGADAKDLQDVLLQMGGVLETDSELAARIGVNLNDGRTLGERFQQVVKAVADQFDNAAERSVVMSRLFGEEGVRQVNTVIAQVGDLGAAISKVPSAAVISDADVEQAREFKANLAEFKVEMAAFAVTVGQQVIPVMTGLLDLTNQIGEAVGGLGGLLTKNFFGEDETDRFAEIPKRAEQAFAQTGAQRRADAADMQAYLDQLNRAAEEADARRLARLKEYHGNYYAEQQDAYERQLLAAAGAAEDSAAAREEGAARENAATEEAIAKRQQDIEAWQAWRSGINDATTASAQSFADFTGESFASIDAFEAKLAESIVAGANWKNNLVAIGAQTTPEFMAYLNDLGPQAAGLVQELANNQPELERIFGLWAESASQGARDVIGEMESLQAAAESAGMSVGEYLASGLAAGITAGIPDVENRARDAMRRAAAAAREAAQIASPSKVWGEMGEQLLEGLARGIIDGTPEAAIDAALAMEQIDEEAARALRDALRADSEARSLAERISGAFVDELDAQQDEVVAAAQRLMDAAGERLASLWSGIDSKRSMASLREAVSDQERAVAAAAADLAAARADPNADLSDLQERLSDARTGLESANYRLFRELFDSMSPDGGTVTAGSELGRVGLAAGLTLSQIQDLVNAATIAQRTEDNVAAQAAAGPTLAQQQAAYEAALAKFFTPGNAFVPPSFESMVQAFGTLLDEVARRRGGAA